MCKAGDIAHCINLQVSFYPGRRLSVSFAGSVLSGAPAHEGEGCWWRWVGMDIYASKNWIVIWGDNLRRGYDRVEGSIGRSSDEVKGVTMSASRNFHMLSEITTGKKVEKFDCLSIA